MTLETVELDLVDLIEETVVLFGEPAQRKGLELAVMFTPLHHEPLRVWADPLRLRQILSNLLSNAVKFTEHGEIVVQVTLVEQTPTEVRVQLCVQDTGIGIAPQAQAKIFDQFSQADGSTTSRFGGTGLGLAICRRLVGLMSGTIRVDSMPGQGSTFSVDLRLPAVTAPSTAALPIHPLHETRVLIVDDNRTSRDILKRQLEALGASTECAENGFAALRLMTEGAAGGAPFALAVLDLQMPTMDGVQLAQAIRELPHATRTPLVLLTLAHTNLDPRTLHTVEPARAVSKPIRQRELFRVVTELLTSIPPRPSSQVPAAYPTLEGSVLLVEDTDINQELMQAMLTALGLCVSVVSNGQEAVDRVRACAFDLVLMDCQMPVMDGYEATAAIRALPPGRGRNVPIVAVTANALHGEGQKCLNAGMDAYLAKPFTMSQLHEVLTRWLHPGRSVHARSAAR